MYTTQITKLKIGMCPKANESVVIQGFTVLQTRYEDVNKPGHNIYIKEHTVRGSHACKPTDRTLFVVNVPPYCTEEILTRIFSTCGKVTNVYMYDQPNIGPPKVNESKFFPDFPTPKGFKVAYLVFKKASSVKKAITLPYDKPLIFNSESTQVITGIKKWCQEYSKRECNISEMQTEIDKYMEKYDQKQEEEKRKALESEGVPDEDGWITVTRHGKNKGAPRTETMEKKVTAKDKKKQMEKELKNFYAFQMRESKRDSIATLRKKFEEDKQRIAVMKASRKFRPY